MQLYFIRHGQSANNLLWQRTGSSKERSSDPQLTETGWQQAKALAQFLRRASEATVQDDRDSQNVSGYRITHIYSSLMIRSVATGTVIARALDLPLVAWEELHETGGIYRFEDETGERIGEKGKNRAYFEGHFPDLVLPGSLGDDGWWDRPFEEPEHRPARAQRFLRQLLERHADTEDRVAVVSHAGFYNHVMAALLDLSRRDGRWFILNNAAITRVDFDAESIALVYLNRADFLPGDLVT